MRLRAILGASFAATIFAACGSPAPPQHPQASAAPLTLAAEERMLVVPGGKFIAGSTPEERQASYDDFLSATGDDGAREKKLYDAEEDRHIARLPAFKIDLFPVTVAAFAEFVQLGKAPAPTIDEATWKAEGFSEDFATQVARALWTNGTPPQDRLDHPVVLITLDEAQRYCAWRGEMAGSPRRLPTALEFEKASRGDNGLAYPWGNAYVAANVDDADTGPHDTVPVGSFTTGASPYGVLGMAGNVYQWTSTPGPAGTVLVKGSAWDDHAGAGRAASSHGRKPSARDVVLGFRCAGDAPR